MTLPEKVVALHRALESKDVPHAFGGALALAYCTLNPRGTSDIDLNVFVSAAEASGALEALPGGVVVPAGTAETIEADGQIRLWWDETPIDLFFDYEPVHADAARHARVAPFAGIEIPVLGPVELAVFKAMFDRTQDWADIEAMAAADRLDVEAVRAALQTLLEPDDMRFDRLDEAVGRGGAD